MRLLICLTALLLLLGNSSCQLLHRGLHLRDVLTASLIGAAIGELHHAVRQTPLAPAAQTQRPVFLPFEAQASHLLPTPFLQHEPFVPSWEAELLPIASDIVKTVLRHRHSLHGLHDYEPFGKFSNLDLQWQALGSSPIETLLRLGMD